MVDLPAELSIEFVQFVIPLIAGKLPDRLKRYLTTDTEKILQALTGPSEAKHFEVKAHAKILEAHLIELENLINQRDHSEPGLFAAQFGLLWNMAKRQAMNTNDKAQDAFGDKTDSSSNRIQALLIMVACAAVEHFDKPQMLLRTWQNIVDFLLNDRSLREIIIDNEQGKIGADKASYAVIGSFLSALTAHAFQLAIIYKRRSLPESAEMENLIKAIVDPQQLDQKYKPMSCLPRHLLESASNILGAQCDYSRFYQPIYSDIDQDDVLESREHAKPSTESAATKPRRPPLPPKPRLVSQQESPIKELKIEPALAIPLRPNLDIRPPVLPNDYGQTRNSGQISNSQKSNHVYMSNNKAPLSGVSHEAIPYRSRFAALCNWLQCQSCLRCKVLVFGGAMFAIVVIIAIVVGVSCNKKEKKSGFILLFGGAEDEDRATVEKCFDKQGANNDCKRIESEITDEDGGTSILSRAYYDQCAATNDQSNIWFVGGTLSNGLPFHIAILNVKTLKIRIGALLSQYYSARAGCAFFDGFLYTCNADYFHRNCEKCNETTCTVFSFPPADLPQAIALYSFNATLNAIVINGYPSLSLLVYNYNPNGKLWTSVSAHSLDTVDVTCRLRTAVLHGVVYVCFGKLCYELIVKGVNVIAWTRMTAFDDDRACPNIVAFDGVLYAFGFGPTGVGVKQYENGVWIDSTTSTLSPRNCLSVVVAV